MKRPITLSGEQGDYIKYLESLISKYESKKTLVNSYHALKKMVDDINDIMTNGIELAPNTPKISIISSEALSSKDDKILDRIFKFIDHLGDYNKQLKVFELDILPELKIEEDNFAGELERALSKK